MGMNAPRMVTVALALALTLAGLSLTVFHIQAVDSVTIGLLTEAGLEVSERHAGWAALLASPLALVAGSLLRGV